MKKIQKNRRTLYYIGYLLLTLQNMAESPKFDPADYLDGGKKKFNGNDYASLTGLNSEKIKQIALARIAARKEEAVTMAQDKEA